MVVRRQVIRDCSHYFRSAVFRHESGILVEASFTGVIVSADVASFVGVDYGSLDVG